MKLDIGNYSRPQVAKMLKGYVANKLFVKFPILKKKYLNILKYTIVYGD